MGVSALALHALLVAWGATASIVPPQALFAAVDGPVLYRGGATMCAINVITRSLPDGTTATMEADACWPCPWPQDCPPPTDILDTIPQMIE